MSRSLSTWNKIQKKLKKGERREYSPEERLALHRLRHEAKKAGAKLKGNGKGGLPPSLVLTVFRRDEFTCKVHGDHGEDENGGLTLHHKGGIVESDWLSKKGHKNDKNNLVTLCNRAHDEMHNAAREDGTDSSQVEPEGDTA